MRVVRTILMALIIVMAGALIILLAGVRLVGMQPFVVLSGSMAPAYPVGSVVYAQEVDARELDVGDVITFNMGGNQVATHRIVSIEDEGDSLSFQTKGDANNSVDGRLVPASSVVGKVVFCIPGAGFALQFFQTTWGKAAIGAVAVAFVVLGFAGGAKRRGGSDRGGGSKR